MPSTIAKLDQKVGSYPKLLSGLLSMILVASVALNVLLARKAATLKDALSQVNASGLLKEGEQVPDIEALADNGSRQIVHFNDVGVPTVLYVFTPQCGWCKKNLPNLHTLIDHANDKIAGGYRVLGIALNHEGLAAYLKDENLTFPVYTDVSAPVRNAYHMGGTPTTIVVSPDRKVMKVWIGAYQEETQREIEAYLHLKMPGIS
jgi:peroxiredoxin